MDQLPPENWPPCLINGSLAVTVAIAFGWLAWRSR
jgi:hypothetical protein